MKTIAERTAEIVGSIIVVGALGYWAYYSWVLEPAKDEKRQVKQKAEASQRFTDWAYVAKEKEVAPGETIKLLIVPSRNGTGALDPKCLIYTNREFKTSSMVCLGETQSLIQELE